MDDIKSRFREALDRQVLLTTADVAAISRQSPETVRYWRQQGTGPRWFKLGRSVRYAAEDVEVWLNEARSAAIA